MIVALIEELRPWQWTKNLLLFAGVLFSQQLGSPQLLVRAGAGFIAFSLLSGSVYLVNDLADLEADRRHPKKRKRPLASGRLPTLAGWLALAPLLTQRFGLTRPADRKRQIDELDRVAFTQG